MVAVGGVTWEGEISLVVPLKLPTGLAEAISALSTLTTITTYLSNA